MPIYFKAKSEAHGWLSNFSEHGFTIDGVRWESVEHFYQALKYSEATIRERIRSADTPLKARKMGQDRSLPVRPDWDSMKFDVMRRAVGAKFGQNRRLKEKLLGTADEPLIHESSSDPIWGATRDGVGENRLGVILMELREELRSEG